MRYIVLIIIAFVLSACSEEQQNKFSRLGVSWMEGDYKVSFYEGEHHKKVITTFGLKRTVKRNTSKFLSSGLS